MIKQIIFIAAACLLSRAAIAQHKDAIFLPSAKFVTGNNTDWSSASFDDGPWKSIQTGTVWQEQGFNGYHGYAWYRIHVVISSSLKQKAVWKDSLRIFLAHVNDVDETYLNGVKIGKTGAFPDDAGGYISKWPAIREYHVAGSNAAIKWDGENVIAIKVYDGGGTGGIFMGAPYIDMLEKTDGVAITVLPDSIRYKGTSAAIPITIANHFNTAFTGTLQITISDAALKKNIITKTVRVDIRPFAENVFSFTVPNKTGITLSYLFNEPLSDVVISRQQTIPYILTPAPSLTPHINNAAVFGTHPGSPFLLKIAATGQLPRTYTVQGLPAGLTVDRNTGIISGKINQSGDYPVTIIVDNTIGQAQQKMIIRAGDQLALTPPMGWNSWNCWGINVSAEKVKSSAQALIDKGLADYGWTYINVDDGWEAPQRAKDSSMIPNEKFGNLQNLGDWLHAKGLKFGIYSSPGPRTCGGFLGSYRNEEKDAGSYASWGIDYLKYDWCSYEETKGTDTSLVAYIKPYAIMDTALMKQKRDIIYSLCQYGAKDVWKWGRQVHGQSWRTTEDIEDTWKSFSGIGFEQYNLYSYAGPGHWNDPDMMIVGQVGWGEDLHPSRLTPDEQYTHISLWCMLSAPLLIGCDISRLDAFTLNLLTNPEVLAIDQDVLGKQAQRLVNDSSNQVWVKELADGSKAVGIFNMDTSYRVVKVAWKDIGLKDEQSLRDVWRGQELGTFKKEYSILVAPHGVMLIKIKEAGTNKKNI